MTVHHFDLRPIAPCSALELLDARFAPIADAPREVAIFAYLDPKWRVIATRHVGGGRTASLDIPLRAVIGDALAFDAAAIVMAHNHPSGDPSPSEADYVFTRRLERTLAAIDVRLVDHIVLARGGRVSFRARRLL